MLGSDKFSRWPDQAFRRVTRRVPSYVLDFIFYLKIRCCVKGKTGDRKVGVSFRSGASFFENIVQYYYKAKYGLAGRVTTAEGGGMMSGDSDQYYRFMYSLSRMLFLQQSTEDVLKHLASSVKERFPDATSLLHMSQDTRASELPISQLAFRHDGDDLCTRAFVDGKTAVEKSPGPGGRDGVARAAAVPLSGRQGVYGVLELRAEADYLTPADVEVLTGIGEVAGAAFENAKLFEQSNKLVTELRLVNEMTKRLNQSLRADDIFQYACRELIHVFRAEFACILELDRDKRKFVAQATNLKELLRKSFPDDYGFAGLLNRTKEPVIVSDYSSKPPVDSMLMQLTGSRSLIAAPILVNGEVVGAVLVTHSAPSFFTYDDYKLLLVLAGQIGLAIMKAQLHAELRRMVVTDNLTGLYARKYLDDQIQALQQIDAKGSLIVVDIDDFKQVNDTYGHQTGDLIIRQVSSIIRSCIRDSDIAARWGGEELAIYLPHLGDLQAERVAERIRSRVEAETKPNVTVSCGIAQWCRTDEKISVESLFYKADMALYRAKNNGKNQYRFG